MSGPTDAESGTDSGIALEPPAGGGEAGRRSREGARPGVGRNIRELGAQALVYGVGRGLTRAIGFLLIPIYTRFLTPVDYGQLELLGTIERILLIVGAQGMGTSFFRFYADSKKDVTQDDLVGTSHLYLSLTGIGIAVLVAVFGDALAPLLLPGSEHGPLFLRLLGLNVALSLIVMTPFQLFRAELLASRTVKISLLGFLIQVLLTIYLVTVLRIGILGVLVGQAASSFVLVAVGVYLIRNRFSWKISAGKLGALLRFGLPLILVALARWVLELSDRILIDRLATTYDLGLYSLGSKFANSITIAIIGPFSVAWGAYCFQIAARENGRETFGRVATYLMTLLCFAGLGIVVWGSPVIKLMADESFWGGRVVLFPLVCTNIFSGMVFVLSFGMAWKLRTPLISWIMGGGAVLNVLLNFAFIPPFGISGAAYASMISSGAIAVASHLVSQKLYYIHYEAARLLKVGGAFLVLALPAAFVELTNPVYDTVFRAGLTAGFFAYLFFGGFLLPGEIEYLRSLGRQLRFRRKGRGGPGPG